MIEVGQQIGILPGGTEGEWIAVPPPAPETVAYEPVPNYDTSSLPHPRIIPSKSGNVLSIREALRALHNPLLSPEEMQEQLERDCATVSVLRQRTRHLECLRRTGGISQETSVNTVILKWQHKLTAVVEGLRGNPDGMLSSLDYKTVVTMDELKQNASGQAILTDSLFLSLLEPLSAETIATVVIRQLMRVHDYRVEMDGYPLGILARSIGDALQNEIFAIQISDRTLQRMTSLR